MVSLYAEAIQLNAFLKFSKSMDRADSFLGLCIQTILQISFLPFLGSERLNIIALKAVNMRYHFIGNLVYYTAQKTASFPLDVCPIHFNYKYRQHEDFLFNPKSRIFQKSNCYHWNLNTYFFIYILNFI